jgi:4-amino-4-deoxy-L-arabinose transferase-like glycosyltransferase
VLASAPMTLSKSLFSRTGLIVAWALLVVVPLPIREVMSPDESRFAHQAQSMKTSGDWIVPYIGDDKNVDKPPVLFWSVVIASLPFDRVNETTSRVPSALGALVVLLLTARLGRRLWGVDAIGYGGALVALTGIEFFQKAQWCSCDMTMAAFAFTAITLWSEALFGEPQPPRPRLRIALGWAAVGFGILTKGPVALLWPLFFVVAEAVARRRFRPLLRIVWNPGVALACLIVGGWIYGLGVRAGWDFVYEATIHQNLDRYTNAWNSVQPWWFYSYQMPADLAPWAAFLPAAIAISFRKSGGPGEARATIAARSAALFTLFGLVLFSGSSGKRGVYMMEAFPAISLLIAAAVVEVGFGTLGFALMAAFGIVLGVIAPVAFAFGAVSIPEALAAAAGIAGAIALVVSGLALTAGASYGFVLLRRGRRDGALASAIGGTLVALCLAGTIGGATWSRMQSARPFCERMDAAAPKGERIAVDNAKFEQFMFYTLRKTAVYHSDEELAGVLNDDRCHYAILLRERYDRMRRTPPIAAMAVLAEGRINRHEYVLVGPVR